MMGGQRTQDALSMLWGGTKTATEPYRQFFTSTMDLPSKVVSEHIETLRPFAQKALGSNAGDLMIDQLKTTGGVLAPTLLAPEAEAGELAEGVGAGEETGKAAKLAGRVAKAGKATAIEEPLSKQVGEASHKAHLARHVGRIATGAEAEEGEEQEPRAFATPAPDYRQILQMLGGGLGPLVTARR